MHKHLSHPRHLIKYAAVWKRRPLSSGKHKNVVSIKLCHGRCQPRLVQWLGWNAYSGNCLDVVRTSLRFISIEDRWEAVATWSFFPYRLVATTSEEEAKATWCFKRTNGPIFRMGRRESHRKIYDWLTHNYHHHYSSLGAHHYSQVGVVRRRIEPEQQDSTCSWVLCRYVVYSP